jgi:hypothetical protein
MLTGGATAKAAVSVMAPGLTPEESLKDMAGRKSAACLPSLEAAVRAGAIKFSTTSSTIGPSVNRIFRGAPK